MVRSWNEGRAKLVRVLPESVVLTTLSGITMNKAVTHALGTSADTKGNLHDVQRHDLRLSWIKSAPLADQLVLLYTTGVIHVGGPFGKPFGKPFAKLLANFFIMEYGGFLSHTITWILIRQFKQDCDGKWTPAGSVLIHWRPRSFWS